MNDTGDWLVKRDLRGISIPGVELWQAHLDRSAGLVADLGRLLSVEEAERAARFQVEPARRSFVVSRAALRLILSRLLETNPLRLRFTYSPSGKPALRESAGQPQVRFNLAHSGDLALIAVTRGAGDVGVDIELARDRLDLIDSAGTCFAPQEQALLRQADPSARCAVFYRIWTRKEAVLKAHGQGIASGLRLPDFSGCMTGAARGLSVELGGIRWRVWDIEPAPQYQGAIALWDAPPPPLP